MTKPNRRTPSFWPLALAALLGTACSDPSARNGNPDLDSVKTIEVTAPPAAPRSAAPGEGSAKANARPDEPASVGMPAPVGMIGLWQLYNDSEEPAQLSVFADGRAVRNEVNGQTSESQFRGGALEIEEEAIRPFLLNSSVLMLMSLDEHHEPNGVATLWSRIGAEPREQYFKSPQNRLMLENALGAPVSASDLTGTWESIMESEGFHPKLSVFGDGRVLIRESAQSEEPIETKLAEGGFVVPSSEEEGDESLLLRPVMYGDDRLLVLFLDPASKKPVGEYALLYNRIQKDPDPMTTEKGAE